MSTPLVFSIAVNGYSRLFRACVASQRGWCERNGYEYWLLSQSLYRLSASDASWLKVPLLAHFLSDRPWVGFIDADCEVRPHAPPIDVSLSGGHALYIAPGWSGRLNAGVIFARGGEAAALMHELWRRCEEPVPAHCVAPYENGHVIAMLSGHKAVSRLEHSRWNNNSHLNPDSFIQHYTGPLRRQFMATRTPWHQRGLAKAVSIYTTWRAAPLPIPTLRDRLEVHAAAAIRAYHAETRLRLG